MIARPWVGVIRTVAVLVAVAVAGCASGVSSDSTTPAASPPLYRGIGGGHVPGSSHYFGTGGP
jgi:hypothetical protein